MLLSGALPFSSNWRVSLAITVSVWSRLFPLYSFYPGHGTNVDTDTRFPKKIWHLPNPRLRVSFKHAWLAFSRELRGFVVLNANREWAWRLESAATVEERAKVLAFSEIGTGCSKDGLGLQFPAT